MINNYFNVYNKICLINFQKVEKCGALHNVYSNKYMYYLHMRVCIHACLRAMWVCGARLKEKGKLHTGYSHASYGFVCSPMCVKSKTNLKITKPGHKAQRTHPKKSLIQ